jgi:hypothetical protein
MFTRDPAGDAQALKELGPADIVVGIPSFNEADNIAHVVQQCDRGLREHFGDHDAIIINVDNDSFDDTEAAFHAADAKIPRVYLSTPPGVRGKGNNFFNLLMAAQQLEARAVVAVDADLESITPEWMPRLARPVIEHDHDFVTPVYARNEYDGTITNHVCYPLIYGLLGMDVRQPIGGDFALSGAFARSLLAAEWSDSTRQYGIDVFMTLNALTNGHSVAQTTLGAKIHKPSAPKLGPMFTQVVTTLFSMLVRHRELWLAPQVDRQVEVFDDMEEAEPQELAVDYKSIKHSTLRDYQMQRPVIERALSAGTFALVEDRMNRRGRIRINAETWMRVLYDLLYAFDRSDGDAQIVEATKPLFFARFASFFRYTIDLEHAEAEDSIRRQAEIFREHNTYLLDKYRDADGSEPASRARGT